MGSQVEAAGDRALWVSGRNTGTANFVFDEFVFLLLCSLVAIFCILGAESGSGATATTSTSRRRVLVKRVSAAIHHTRRGERDTLRTRNTAWCRGSFLGLVGRILACFCPSRPGVRLSTINHQGSGHLPKMAITVRVTRQGVLVACGSGLE